MGRLPWLHAHAAFLTRSLRTSVHDYRCKCFFCDVHFMVICRHGSRYCRSGFDDLTRWFVRCFAAGYDVGCEGWHNWTRAEHVAILAEFSVKPGPHHMETSDHSALRGSSTTNVTSSDRYLYNSGSAASAAPKIFWCCVNQVKVK